METQRLEKTTDRSSKSSPEFWLFNEYTLSIMFHPPYKRLSSALSVLVPAGIETL